LSKKQDQGRSELKGIQEPHALVINEYTSKIEISLPQGDGVTGIPIEITNSKFKKFGPDVRLLRIKRINGCPLMEIV